MGINTLKEKNYKEGLVFFYSAQQNEVKASGGIAPRLLERQIGPVGEAVVELPLARGPRGQVYSGRCFRCCWKISSARCR